MSDIQEEIKAILIQDGEPTPNNPVEIKRLLVNKEAEDYITNLQTIEREYSAVLSENVELQEENNKLKELCDKYEEEHSTEFELWKDERHQLLDYKSRNEKAIEIIEKYGKEKQLEEDYLMNRVNLANYNCLLLDTLQGVDKE